MKKHLYILLLLGLVFTTHSFSAFAISETDNVMLTRTERYIKYVYEKIKFPKGHKLKFEAFKQGFYGYLNMQEAGKVASNATLSICDFTLSSNEKRLWIIDVKNKKVLFNTLVAHGMGTGEEFAEKFSNTPDSHQSSLGFYTTAETYEGNNGYSLKLNGIDGSYNNNAYERAIVIHGAEYVSDEFAKANQRLGRSHGCPALPVELAPKIIDKIKDGHCLFIYAGSKQYAKASYWLKNKITHLPKEAELMELNIPSKYVTEEKPSEMTNENTYSEKKAEKVVDIKEKFCSEETKKIADPSKPKKITYIIINENSRTGISDTSIVK